MAPIAGETKVWQYITLMQRIYLIDCPGVVYPSGETDTEKVLKGVVRVELVKNPEDYIDEVLKRVKPEYLKKIYKIDDWNSSNEFLEAIALKMGRLLKGGEPDISTISRLVLNDWQRGKLPYYIVPAGCEVPLSKLNNEENGTPENISEKSENNNTNTNSNGTEIEAKEENEEENNVNKDLSKVKITQNLTKIKVALEYDENTDKELIEKNQVKPIDDRRRKDSSKSEGTTVFSDSSDSEVSYYSEDEDEEEGEDNNEKDDENSNSNKKSKIFNVVQTTSGRFIVTDVDDYDTMRKEFMKGDDKPEKEKRKLTSKQRRAIERAQKRKKIGSNFYEVTNVKNRNRNRKKPKI